MSEPVAWMALFTTKSELGNIQIPDLCLTKPPSHLYDEVIPLYTHPVKELTDEETRSLKEANKNLMELVTMLREEVDKLRKAQEK